MRTVVFLGLIAVGLAACGTSTADPTGWSRSDGTPVKGNAAVEQRFSFDDDKCRGRDMSVYKYCMAGRGYTDEVVPVPVAAAPAIAAAPTGWRARAAEARAVAAQLHDPVTKQMMARIADSYDRLA